MLGETYKAFENIYVMQIELNLCLAKLTNAYPPELPFYR